MRVIISIGYIVLSIIQFAALCTGLQIWLGVNAFFSGVLAFFIAPMPLIGTIAGMCGAVYGWHWSWLAAMALFFGWLFIIIILSVIDGVFFKNKSMLD